MMDERKEGTRPLLLFGALETYHFLKSVVVAWSQRMFFIHIIFLTPWDTCRHASREGGKQVLWDFTLYTFAYKQTVQLWSRTALRWASDFPSVQLLGVKNENKGTYMLTKSPSWNLCMYTLPGLFSLCVEGGKKNPPMCCSETLHLVSWGRRAIRLFCTWQLGFRL